MKNFFIIILLITNFFMIFPYRHYATSISKSKIVYLISPPRSLSVALLRYFEARGDFKIIHEPSQRACNELHKTDFISLFSEDAPRTHEEVAKKLFEKQPDTNLFIKEMSFATIDLIKQHPELLKNPNIHFVFLIRNPHHTIISLYRKQSSTSLADFDWVVGYEPCYTLLEMAKTESPNPPIIVRSEDLYTNPQGTIQAFCTALDIPHIESALSWKSHSDDFDGKAEWGEIKKERDIIHHWHGDAIKSNHFHTPHQYKVNQKGEPTFEEITNPLDKEMCKKAYLDNMLFYEKIISEKGYIISPTI